MKKFTALLFALMLMTLMTSCDRSSGGSAADPDVQIVDVGDSRFLVVELEDTGAEAAQVRAAKSEKAEDGTYVDAAEYVLYSDGGSRYCTVLPTGGTYYLSIDCSDGRKLDRLIVFDKSQVCSLHICLDPKETGDVRTLWPETPHNTPDPEE